MLKRLINLFRKWRETPEQYAKRVGVIVGKGSSIDTKYFSTEPYLLEIGDYVRISSGTSFYMHGGVNALRVLYNDPTLDQFGKIKIGSYSYIGSNCMIMPGVSIGERCIVGGGSVVTKSVPDGCMVAGNPAKFIGYTDDFYRRIKENGFDAKTYGMTYEEKKRILLSLPESAFIKKPCIKIDKQDHVI